MGQIEDERVFHNELVRKGFSNRRLLNRLGQSFYDKEIVWRFVWREVGDLTGKVVLDYGCGAGGFGIDLAKRGANAYGIDISDEYIAIARRRTQSGIRGPEFSVQDAHHTDFPGDYFDLVVGNGVLHHLDLRRAYPEIARVLKKGGKGYFMEPLDGHPALRVIRCLTPKARSSHERPLSFSDIRLASGFFQKVRHDEFFLWSVAAAPLNLVSLRLAKASTGILHLLDQATFRFLPQSRQWAWITLVELEK